MEREAREKAALATPVVHRQRKKTSDLSSKYLETIISDVISEVETNYIIFVLHLITFITLKFFSDISKIRFSIRCRHCSNRDRKNVTCEPNIYTVEY